MVTIVLTPIVYRTLGKYALPSPGEGPSEEEMNKGYLILTAEAKGDKDGSILNA